MQKSPLAIILSTVFIALIGFGIVIPLMPVYAERFGASGFQVGMLVTTYSLTQFLIAPLAGKLSDKIGRRPVIIVALFLTAVSYVVFGMADNLVLLFVSRAVAGIGGADITVAQAYIADVTPANKRAKGMGLFGAAFGMGFVVGPTLTALTYEINEGLPSFIAAGLAGTTALLALFMLPEPARHEEYKGRTLKPGKWMTRILGILMSFQFVTVLMQALLQSMLVLFTVHQLGWNEKNNGLFLAMIGGIAAIVQGGLIGRLQARFGEHNLTRTGLLLMGIGLYLFSRVGDVRFLYAGGVINSLGFALTLPSLSSLASQQAPPGRQGQVLGSFQSMGSLARIIGPLAGGALYDTFNPNAPFLAGAIIAGFAFIGAMIHLRGSTMQPPEAAKMIRRARLRHIIATEFIFLIGFAMMVPLLLYARSLGAAGTMVGMLLAANQAVDFFFAPVAGRLSDRYGRRSVLLPAMALTALAYLGVGLADSKAMLFLVWTIAGLGSAHVLLSQAYVADVTDDAGRTRGMGLWGAGFAMAFVVGPPSGALLFEASGQWAAVVAAIMAGLATVYAFVFLGEPNTHRELKAPSRSDTFRHLRNLRRSVVTIVALNFAVIFIWSQFTTILPLFSEDVLHWEVRQYGMYLGTVGIISAVLQGGLVGPLVKRLGHGIPVTLGFGLLGGGLGLLATVRGPVTLGLSAFGIATGFGLLIPTLPALLSMNVNPERKGLALGVFQSASTFARVIAPLLAGVVYDRGFASAPFLMSATFGLIVMVVVSVVRLKEPGTR